ncbi:MAG: hypothetical protein JXQ73_09095 [Phycisphaerae bacterium]|nr:hypothetical protein [Phycisphaerae bacterium]
MFNLIIASATLVGLSATTSPANAPHRGVQDLDKKLIEYGWDVPFPGFLRQHVAQMQTKPFDGLVFKLEGGGKVLTPTPWTDAQFADDYENLRQIQWGRLTDNFVIMWAASDQDWFNDEHWNAIENNVRLVARAARIARCVGVCFDPEPYGANPWQYDKLPHRASKTFEQYETVARRRGRQFLLAIQAELPRPKLLTFFQISYVRRLAVPMAPGQRKELLARETYGLLPAFLNGMLDAAEPGAVIIDGNELSYYYTQSEQYFRAYQQITQNALLLIDPALWDKYRAHVRAGQALYVDEYFAKRTTKTLGHYMSPPDQAKWFQHNAYWALQTTDQYVWCYSERMNWWTGAGLPDGCEQAIRSAWVKYREDYPLGFDLAPIVNAATQKERLATAAKTERRTATIRKLPQGVDPPKIDGVLNDEAWNQTKPLPEFKPLGLQSSPLKAATLAWLAYDDRALYIAFRCQEPTPDQMPVYGDKHDDEVWRGDDIEIMISAPGNTKPFYHFMLNPKGVAWDAVSNGPVSDHNPPWDRAVRIGLDYWIAEMAIPWSSLKMTPPTPGMKLGANLCRQRCGTQREWSSWSPMKDSFLVPELFGTWSFE